MPITSQDRLRAIVRKSVPRLKSKGPMPAKGEKAAKIQQTLQEQAKEHMKKLGK